ncbi:MAG TPA: DNA primase [Acidimicrobiia bacterium]
MGILDEDVARVREATSIVAVVSEHLALRRVGRRYQGLCPFHTEKTASFTVNPELGLYHCFGCGVGGDAISFVREVEHLDFVGAVERLASRAGIQLRYDDAAVGKERNRRQRLVETVAVAAGFYHQLLLEAPEAGTARRYLRSRGYDGEVARRFQLGFAPDRFDAVAQFLTGKKFSRQDLLDAGLCFVNRADRLQDHFRGRVMFPIYDARGDAVGFGGRALEAGGPKYKNSPESAVYQKSRVLYGLNWAKEDIVAKNEAVVCEGYTDVLAFFLSGVPRAVATCGTALVEDHLRLLKNFTPTLVLAYDADDAGQAAAERIYQWEARYDMRLSVADLPAGQDPADVGRADPAALVAAVSGARPFLRFRLDRLLASADTASAEGRAKAANAAVTLVAEHPDDLVRDQYLMDLAERLAIDVERLRRAAASPAPRGAPAAPPGDRPADGAPRRPAPLEGPEVEALRVAVHAPELVAGRIRAEVFGEPVAREAFVALASSATFHEALGRAMGAAADLLERLAVEDPPWGENPDAYATSVLVQVTEAAAERRLRVMVRAGDDRASELKHLLDELVAARQSGAWAVAHRAAAQLLPWVGASGEE